MKSKSPQKQQAAQRFRDLVQGLIDEPACGGDGLARKTVALAAAANHLDDANPDAIGKMLNAETDGRVPDAAWLMNLCRYLERDNPQHQRALSRVAAALRLSPPTLTLTDGDVDPGADLVRMLNRLAQQALAALSTLYQIERQYQQSGQWTGSDQVQGDFLAAAAAMRQQIDTIGAILDARALATPTRRKAKPLRLA